MLLLKASAKALKARIHLAEEEAGLAERDLAECDAVLEAATDLADEKASFCSRLLADMGARVIKIERPGGDESRKRGHLWKNVSHPEMSLSFFYNNTNKLSITLNLEHC